MQYAAIGLAIFGALLGLCFRFRALLPFLLLLLIISIWVIFEQQFSIIESLLLITAPQVILQASYFIGLATRSIFRTAQHRLAVTDDLPATKKRLSNAGSTRPTRGMNGT